MFTIYNVWSAWDGMGYKLIPMSTFSCAYAIRQHVRQRRMETEEREMERI